jgi:hypothetical protein
MVWVAVCLLLLHTTQTGIALNIADKVRLKTIYIILCISCLFSLSSEEVKIPPSSKIAQKLKAFQESSTSSMRGKRGSWKKSRFPYTLCQVKGIHGFL